MDTIREAAQFKALALLYAKGSELCAEMAAATEGTGARPRSAVARDLARWSVVIGRAGNVIASDRGAVEDGQLAEEMCEMGATRLDEWAEREKLAERLGELEQHAGKMEESLRETLRSIEADEQADAATGTRVESGPRRWYLRTWSGSYVERERWGLALRGWASYLLAGALGRPRGRCPDEQPGPLFKRLPDDDGKGS